MSEQFKLEKRTPEEMAHYYALKLNDLQAQLKLKLNDLQAQLKAAQDALYAVTQQNDELRADYNSMAGQLTTVTQERANMNCDGRCYTFLNAQLDAVTRQLADAIAERDALEAENELIKRKFKAFERAMGLLARNVLRLGAIWSVPS